MKPISFRSNYIAPARGISSRLPSEGRFTMVSRGTFFEEVSKRHSSWRSGGAHVGKFPYDTYLDGKGFQINPAQKEDKSAFVGLTRPPAGHISVSEEATRWGYRNLYVKKGPNDSVYTINFTDANPKLSIDQHVEERKQKFFERYPQGQASPVTLNPTVTAHLNQKQVSYKTMLFDAINQANPYEHPLGKMVFFLKTPGGFWDLSWHSAVSSLREAKHQALFADTVKDFKVVLLDQEEDVESNADAVEAEEKIAKPKVDVEAEEKMESKVDGVETEKKKMAN